MGTIADKTAALASTKADIKSALQEQGQQVNDVFSTYGDAIRAIAPGVSSFNDRTGAVSPSADDYSAEMIKFTDGQTVQQKYDAGELGPGEQYSFSISTSVWKSYGNEYQAVELTSFAEKSGFAYIFSLDSAYSVAPYKLRFSLNNGLIFIYASALPSETLNFTVAKYKIEGTSITFSAIAVAQENTLPDQKSYSNSVLFSTIVSKTVSPGRVTGDVNGDGLITDSDSVLVTQYLSGSGSLDETQIECAKISGGSSVTTYDGALILQIASGSVKAGAVSHDITDTWTVNPNYATEDGQFYLDVTDLDVSTTSDFLIVFGGPEAEKITNVVPSNGSFRVYMTVPPISAMPYKIL